MEPCKTESCRNTTNHWSRKCNPCRKRNCATAGCGREFIGDGVRKHCSLCLNKRKVILRKGDV